MKTDTALSDYWRINRSQIAHVELTNALKAMRKVIGNLGLDILVVWQGMTPERDRKRIELPASLVMGEYPIPPEKMDVLIGYGVHEAMHHLENSYFVRDYHYNKHKVALERDLILKIVEMVEDIHIDGLIRTRWMFSRYVQKFRDWWVENRPSTATEFMPTLEGMLESCASIVLDIVYPNTLPVNLDALGDIPKDGEWELKELAGLMCAGDKALTAAFLQVFDNQREEYNKPLKMFLALTRDIVAGKPRDRSGIIDDYWEKWGTLFIRWTKQAREWVTSQEEESKVIPLFGAPPPMDGLESDLAAAIDQNLAAETEDTNKMILFSLKSVGGENLNWALFPTNYKDGEVICKTLPNIIFSQRIRDVFQLQKREARVIDRGLVSGKLDVRRLYRVKTTKQIFMEKQYDPRSIWDVTVLVDASSSMVTYWKLIEKIFATLVEAWRTYQNELELFAYAEYEGTCTITNLYRQGRLFTIQPGGNTPSGQAILAVASHISKKREKRLLLHFTDGKINVGVDIDYAIDFCKKEKIDLMTIGPGTTDMFELTDKYGTGLFQIIDSLNELPKALMNLLRYKLLGRR